MKSTLVIFFVFCFALLGCNGKVKTDEEKMMDLLKNIPIPETPDSLKVKKGEDFPLEVAFLELLKQDSIQIDSLGLILEKGADINIVLEVTEHYTYTKAGAKIPILKNFISNKTESGTRKVLQNPLQCIVEQKDVVNKMDVMLWMLNKGADPNIRAEDDMLPIETLMQCANTYKETMGVYYDPSSFFHRSMENKIAAANYPNEIGNFTMHYFDTLVAYGADLSQVNMRYAGHNIFLIEKLLIAGTDPINMDINEFFRWGIAFQPEKKIDEILANPLPYDSLDNTSFILGLEIHQIEICLENGLNPNQKCGRDYLLAHAIRLRNTKKLKLLLDYGGNKADDEGSSPLEFAKENEITDERILDMLEEIPLL